MDDLRRELDQEWCDFRLRLGDLIQDQQDRQGQLVATYTKCLGEMGILNVANGALNAAAYSCVHEDPCRGNDLITDVHPSADGIIESECLGEGCSPTSKRSDVSRATSNLTKDSSERGRRRSTTKTLIEHQAREEMQQGTWLQRLVYRRCRYLVEWWIMLEEPPRTGPLAWFIDGPYFETLCFLVILINAFFAIHTANYEMQHINSPSTDTIMIIERVFVCWYTIELFLRCLVHRVYLFVGPNARWNMFDSVLVVLAIFDLIMASVAQNSTFMRSMRIIRVAKISRTIRLVRFFRELRLILYSLMGSLVSLFWSIVMLVLIFYLFALVLVNNTANFLNDRGDSINDELKEQIWGILGSVQRTMLTLYMTATGGDDWSTYYSTMAETGNFNAFIFIVYIAFIEIAVLNILTGIFVETALKHAQPDPDMKAVEVRRIEHAQKRQMLKLCEELDKDGSGTLTKDEFIGHMGTGKLKYFMATVGLDVRDAEHFFELLEDTSSEVNIGAFVDACMKLKGSASSIDMQMLILKTVRNERYQRQFEGAVLNKVRQLSVAMSRLIAPSNKIQDYVTSPDNTKQISGACSPAMAGSAPAMTLLEAAGVGPQSPEAPNVKESYSL